MMRANAFTKFVGAALAATVLAAGMFIVGCGSDDNSPTGGGEGVQFTLTTVSNPTNGGIVSPVGETRHDYGETVGISATAADGFRFVNWMGAGVDDANSANTIVSMTENRHVIANFVPDVPDDPDDPDDPDNPTCEVGVDCDDDEGYCDYGCTLTIRADCGSGTFSSTRPEGCDNFTCGQYNPETQFCDSRDGKAYRYVEIGNQVWMAENLNFNTVSGSSAGILASHGRLYDWATAMNIDTSFNSTLWGGSDVNHRGVCPQGWHLPSDDEWNTLINFVGDSAGTKLKTESENDWFRYVYDELMVSPGTDAFGFSALPALRAVLGEDGRYTFTADEYGSTGYWWTASKGNDAAVAHNRIMYALSSSVGSSASKKTDRLSVRCVRDE